MDRVVRKERDVPWLPQPNECALVLSDAPPPSELVTAAFVLAFGGADLLMIRHVRRGIDVPGGHVEPGETPAEAAAREVLEEAGARVVGLAALGYQHHRLLGLEPAEYVHPYPDSYMAFYTARIAALQELIPNGETAGRLLLPPDEARRLAWVRANPELFEAALERISGGDG